ncbi:hypothetical protein ACFZCB_32970, partial [Streptomyces pseudovenezuelae]
SKAGVLEPGATGAVEPLASEALEPGEPRDLQPLASDAVEPSKAGDPEPLVARVLEPPGARVPESAGGTGPGWRRAEARFSGRNRPVPCAVAAGGPRLSVPGGSAPEAGLVRGVCPREFGSYAVLSCRRHAGHL